MMEPTSTRRPLKLVAAFAAVGTLALAACATDGEARPPRPGPAAAGSTAGSTTLGEPVELELGALGPRELASGQCGLFLWTRTASPTLVFFADPTTGRAAVTLDGRERALRRVGAEAATSAAAGGRPGAQTFATESGDLSVRLSVQGSEPVENGYRVTGASLRLTDADGWSGVVATAGLAACQP
jgi:hypothetical protein